MMSENTSRRSFLKAAAAVSAIGVPMIVPSRVLGGPDAPSNKLNIAGIGIGGMGGGNTSDSGNGGAGHGNMSGGEGEMAPPRASHDIDPELWDRPRLNMEIEFIAARPQERADKQGNGALLYSFAHDITNNYALLLNVITGSKRALATTIAETQKKAEIAAGNTKVSAPLPGIGALAK